MISNVISIVGITIGTALIHDNDGISHMYGN